ncbi:MAG: hypothetical protein K940chlam3_00467 [Chlamydiae bacterium]|nr:hypothetical protein [Chlamydiota bacterium]
MNNYVGPKYKTIILNPVKTLDIEQSRPSSKGLWLKRGIIKVEHAVVNRAYVLHTCDVDLIKAGVTTVKAVKDWTLFAASMLPLLNRAVPKKETRTFRKAFSTSLKIMKYAFAAVTSPIAGFIKPSWSVTIHEKLGLYTPRVATKVELTPIIHSASSEDLESLDSEETESVAGSASGSEESEPEVEITLDKRKEPVEVEEDERVIARERQADEIIRKVLSKTASLNPTQLDLLALVYVSHFKMFKIDPDKVLKHGFGTAFKECVVNSHPQICKFLELKERYRSESKLTDSVLETYLIMAMMKDEPDNLDNFYRELGKARLIHNLLASFSEELGFIGTLFGTEANDRIQSQIGRELAFKIGETDLFKRFQSIRYQVSLEDLKAEIFTQLDLGNVIIEIIKEFLTSKELKILTNKEMQKVMQKKFQDVFNDKFTEIEALVERRKRRMIVGVKEENRVFGKWGFPFELPLIQGFEDEQAILGGGICWGNCHNLAKQEKANPEKLIRKIELTSGDRKMQAELELRFNKEPRILGAEQEINCFDEISDYSQLSDKALEILANHDEELQDEAYIVGMTLKGPNSSHQVYFRADPVNEIYHFYDPNLGLSKEFPLDREHPSYADPAQEMLECFQDFMTHTYEHCFNRITFRKDMNS